MPFQLNHKAAARLRALISAGKYVDKPWSFSAGDSNALLGGKEGGAANWTEYGNWFLGQNETAPVKTKARVAYPFGKDGVVYLAALRAIASRASANGDGQIAAEASKALEHAKQRDDDEQSSGANDSGGSAKAIAFVSRLHIRAQEAGAGADGATKGPRKFDMTAYTGGPMLLEGWKHPVVVDLEGIQPLPGPRPALRDHDTSKIVGHVEHAAVQDGKLLAGGVISGHGPHVDEVVNAADRGFPWQSSIGARVEKNQFIPDGQSAVANGQAWDGPVNIARSTSLGEISFVGLGADDQTSAHISARAAARSAGKARMKFKAWAEARGIDCSKFSAQEMECLKKAHAASDDYEPDEDGDGVAAADDSNESDNDDAGDDAGDDKPGETKAQKAPQKNVDGKAIAAAAADIKKSIRAEAAAENKRIAAIRKLCAGGGAGQRSHPEIEAKAVEEGWTAEKAEVHVLRAARAPLNPIDYGQYGQAPAAGGVAARKIIDASPDQIYAAAACLSVGMSEKIALARVRKTGHIVAFDDNQSEIAHSLRSQASIQGLFHIFARAHGLSINGGHLSEDDIVRCIGADRQLNIRADGGSGLGGFSTMSLSGVTENILNKALLAGYGVIESRVANLCYQTDTNDFKTFKRYRLTASGKLKQVGPDGEVKAMSLQDESYANQVKTYGCIVGLTREIIINDDMSALTELPTAIGMECAMTREEQVFTAYLSLKNLVATGPSLNQPAPGFNFVSSGAKNYLIGAASALGLSALSTAVKQFREMKNANGRPIMIPAGQLILPPSLEATGDNLFQGANLTVQALDLPSQTSGTSAAQSGKQVVNLNQHKGKYTPTQSPFLGAQSSITAAGNVAAPTDTQWSLLPPAQLVAAGFAPLQIGYLRGTRVPTIERGEAPINMLGIYMRAIYDFGVAAHDYRCIQWSDGV